MGAQKDGGGQSEGLKVREVVCDLLMEVRGLTGSAQGEAKVLQRHGTLPLLDQLRAALRMLVDQKKRALEVARESEADKERQLLGHLSGLQREVAQLKEERDAALAGLSEWRGQLEGTLAQKAETADASQRQALELEAQLRDAKEKIATMEKESKLLYKSTSEFVRKIHEQDNALGKAQNLRAEMAKAEARHQRDLAHCQKAQVAKVDAYERSLRQASHIQLENENLRAKITALEQEVKTLKNHTTLREVRGLTAKLATQEQIAQRNDKKVRKLEEQGKRLTLKMDLRDRENSTLQREYDRVYGKLRDTKKKEDEPQLVAPTAAREETHIEAQLRYKLEEKEEEIAALKLKLKTTRLSEKKGVLQTKFFDEERRLHQKELDEWRYKATALDLNLQEAEQRAMNAEGALDRAERTAELSRSQSAAHLGKSGPSIVTLATTAGPSPLSSADSLRPPRPRSAHTGRELPAKQAVGATSSLRPGELLSRPQSAQR